MQIFLYILCGIPLAFITLHTLVRIIRRFYKFPMPESMANLIDHPLRRKLQPEYETAVRHGIESVTKGKSSPSTSSPR
jgi:hypothetical protein